MLLKVKWKNNAILRNTPVIISIKKQQKTNLNDIMYCSYFCKKPKRKTIE